MADETDVRILQWPDQQAQLLHSFNPQEPPTVTLNTAKGEPMQVEMNMLMRSTDAVRLCISVCEPICAQSEYTIGIEIFDRPVAAITVRGLTKFFNCPDRTTTGGASTQIK